MRRGSRLCACEITIGRQWQRVSPTCAHSSACALSACFGIATGLSPVSRQHVDGPNSVEARRRFALFSRATLALVLFGGTREPHLKSPPPARSASLKRDLQSVYLLECSERNKKWDCFFRAAKDSPAPASLPVLFFWNRRLPDETRVRSRWRAGF